MQRTTVYLPEELKERLERLALSTRRSEASLIRDALARLVGEGATPRPRGGLWASGDPSLAEHADDALAGFGDR